MRRKFDIAISKAVRSETQVGAVVEVSTSARRNEGAVLYIVLADKRDQSTVSRGENAGRTLAHVSVARALAQCGPLNLRDGPTKQVVLSVPPGAGARGLQIVAFLQDPSSGHVLGAALRKLDD